MKGANRVGQAVGDKFLMGTVCWYRKTTQHSNNHPITQHAATQSSVGVIWEFVLATCANNGNPVSRHAAPFSGRSRSWPLAHACAPSIHPSMLWLIPVEVDRSCNYPRYKSTRTHSNAQPIRVRILNVDEISTYNYATGKNQGF